MKFRVSTNTAVLTPNPDAAKTFYGDVLGFPIEDTEHGSIVDAGPVQLFIDSETTYQGIVLELVVKSVEDARVYLEQNGCKVLRWDGAGKACFIEDPFGIRFNIRQD